MKNKKTKANSRNDGVRTHTCRNHDLPFSPRDVRVWHLEEIFRLPGCVPISESDVPYVARRVGWPSGVEISRSGEQELASQGGSK
jgi:hypothetical protein